MKNLGKLFLLIGLLTLPMAVHAESMAEGKQCDPAQCPMMKMQKDMGDMMKEMDSMMANMSDPAMKERMAKMHEHMDMMSHMECKCCDMKGDNADTGKTEVPASTDHSEHHPEAQQ